MDISDKDNVYTPLVVMAYASAIVSTLGLAVHYAVLDGNTLVGILLFLLTLALLFIAPSFILSLNRDLNIECFFNGDDCEYNDGPDFMDWKTVIVLLMSVYLAIFLVSAVDPATGAVTLYTSVAIISLFMLPTISFGLGIWKTLFLISLLFIALLIAHSTNANTFFIILMYATLILLVVSLAIRIKKRWELKHN